MRTLFTHLVFAILFTCVILALCEFETPEETQDGLVIAHNQNHIHIGLVEASSSVRIKERSLKSKSTSKSKPRYKKKNKSREEEDGDDEPDTSLPSTHGVINTLAWGLFFPLGVMSARYLRHISDTLWFYLHISFQSMAFLLGISGFSIGIKLGKEFEGIGTQRHRAIAITLFTFSIVQVVGLVAKLSENQKLIKIWKVCHHIIGYTIIILGIINIFDGFDILQPARKWCRAYIGVLTTLVVAILVLEVLTWTRCKSKHEDQLKLKHNRLEMT